MELDRGGLGYMWQVKYLNLHPAREVRAAQGLFEVASTSSEGG